MESKSHQTMRAVAIDEFGGIEKMKPRELPVPEVAPDEILVRVDTAGVGVWDPFEPADRPPWKMKIPWYGLIEESMGCKVFSEQHRWA